MATNVYIFERSQIENEINFYIEYFDKEEKELKNLQITYERKFFDYLNSSDETQAKNASEGMFEFKYFDTLPSLVYESNFIWVGTFWERWMRAICLDYINHNNNVPPFNKRKPFLDDYKNYLINEVKIDWSQVSVIWDELQSYRLIRNLIVHNSNVYNDATADLKQFIETNHSIGYSIYDVYDVKNILTFSINDKAILSEFSNKLKRFLFGLLDEVEKTIP